MAQKCYVKKLLLKVLQNLHRGTCAGVSFSRKLQEPCNFINKDIPAPHFLKFAGTIFCKSYANNHSGCSLFYDFSEKKTLDCESKGNTYTFSNWSWRKAVNYFDKRAASQMFDWVLDMPLSLYTVIGVCIITPKATLMRQLTHDDLNFLFKTKDSSE